MSKKRSFRGFMIAVIIAAMSLPPSLALAATGGVGPAPNTPAYRNFQRSICRLSRKMNNAAAASIYQFNTYYYNSPATPENLEAAGSWAQHAYTIYSNYNDSIRKIKAPTGYQGYYVKAWHRYNVAERQVLKFGFKGADALLQANSGLFHVYENKNLTWQRKRNSAFAQTGVYCG